MGGGSWVPADDELEDDPTLVGGDELRLVEVVGALALELLLPDELE